VAGYLPIGLRLLVVSNVSYSHGDETGSRAQRSRFFVWAD
jgi:hypothetical protein